MLGAGAGYTLLVGLVPAPEPIVEAIQQIDVECALEEASVLRIEFGISATKLGDWSILDIDPFRPLTPLQLRVQRGAGAPEALINAFVTEHRVTYSEGGRSKLQITGLDATYAMNLQEKVRAYLNLPDSAIASMVFAEHAIVPRVDPTTPVLTDPEGTTVQRGTDIRFLRRLARRNGFDCYVQPEPLSGLDVGHFRKRQLTGLPQAVLSVEMGTETNVCDFSIRYELTRPTAAIAAGLDVLTKAPQPAVAPTALEQPLGLEGTLLRQLPPPIARPADTGLPRTAELQRAAQALVDRSTWSVVAEGTVGLDVPVLRPGGLVSIRGAGRLYNGSYYVTRVQHTIKAGGGIEQRFEAARNAVTETGAELYMEVA
ncbi:MAG TPA: contractile injection system protein, VgrG/Pvc8 family [Gaiellaceae bacterium]|nr:contractile injection system protein, VgrG/Pvc8 family [Gaiellaceae bacterium]